MKKSKKYRGHLMLHAIHEDQTTMTFKFWVYGKNHKRFIRNLLIQSIALATEVDSYIKAYKGSSYNMRDNGFWELTLTAPLSQKNPKKKTQHMTTLYEPMGVITEVFNWRPLLTTSAEKIGKE